MIEATFVHPVLFSLGGFSVYSYGVMVAAALASCTMVLSRDLARLGINDADASAFMLSFIPGFAIGSKAQMVLSAALAGESMPDIGLASGHSFMGSAVGGVLTATAYGCFCGLSPLQLLDLIAPLVPLGHAVGKWGCFLSGDGCYGPRTSADLPWAMSFPNGGVPEPNPVHPTPLYESLLSGTLFAFLHLWLSVPAVGENRRLPLGRRAAVTLVLYGIERMAIEPWRRHPPSDYLWGLTEYQFLAVVFMLLGAIILLAARGSAPWPDLLRRPAGKSEKAKTS